ncbi:MAG: hypothetical protein KDA38_05190, partial [Planctomycetales bacterium]|nr:hypothetical protein [Planctomycetales bacterium]
VSFLELRGDTFIADRFDALSIDGGILRVAELPPGDYDLLLKRSGARMRIRLTDGAKLDNWVLGEYRQLETRDNSPLQLDPIQVGEKTITVNVRNANPFTRVHVFATRFVPAYDPFGNLSIVRDAEPSRYLLPEQLSHFMEGRIIGDEIRYILDRKYAPKYPGNMLERPELLLNPWAIRQTETSQQEAQLGSEFAPSADPQAMTAKPGQGGRGVDGERTDFSTLDFLALDSAVLLNLAPNEEGQLTLDRDALGPHQHLHIVAVDPQNTVYRTTSLAAGDVPFEDLRLADGLDPDKHFTQQKQTSVIQPGEEFVLPDITSSRFELYDSLRRVHSLYVTLSNNPNLVEFNFVLNWPKLTPDEKRSKYSQYASHELHFFLAQKDPQWFNENIRPYLENKKDKTFLDQYLLGENLSQYLFPWEFERLNIVERILLGRRLEAEASAMQRHVHERYELLPPNIDRRNFLFETALKGSSLETDDRFGVVDALKKTKQEQGEFRGEAKDADRALQFGGQAMNRNGTALFGRANAPQPAAPPAAAMPALAEKAAAGKRLAEEQLGELQNARKEMESGLARRRQAGADDKSERAYFKADEKLRAKMQQLYRQVDKTKEWVENNYYHLPIEQQNGDLVTVNAFWNDFAQHPADQPFYSTNMAEASRNFTEMMFALSVLDLPFEAGEHQTEYEKAAMTLEVGSPSIVYHEEIKQAEQMALQTPILVSQNFFRHGDRYAHVDGEQRDKYVTDEFLVHAVYGCQVVVTNPTSTPRKLDLLLQIPNGAIPVMGSKYTRSVHINLQPFNTQTVEYHFYFPAAGEFTHYPVHVAQNEELLAYADPVKLNVVAKPSKIDRESWQYISQYGTDAQVMEFLRQHNLQRLELDKIAFRMRDKAFFQQVVNYLAEQHAYNQTLWSYSVYHDVPDQVKQFLKHADSYINQVGWYIDSPLLELDPIARHIYQHMEYKPLVNARRHQLGNRREIVNDRFHQQYHRFLKLLSYHAEPTDEQELEATYYLLLQERVAEAFDFFGRVNPEQLNERLQYDYFTAYLAFYKADPQQARDIAENYSNHPVDRWREAFLAIVAQADEIEGAGVEVIDDENLAQSQTKLAAADTSFDFEVESQEVRIDYQNVERVRVNFYLMDIEMLFSRNPFVQQYSSQFSYIQPNQSQVVALPKNKTSFAFSLPAELRNQNVLVEISAGGQTKSEAYYSNSLAVQVIENYGQVRVAHENSKKALAGVYVKVYARMSDGSVKFYKDGYTDLRGRFDFTSLSTNELDNVEKFSLLILSEEHGAVVREANPPRR